MTLSVASDHASLSIAYVPEAWANDPARRSKAGVPDNIVFRSKPVIALEQTGAAVAAGVTPGVVLSAPGTLWSQCRHYPGQDVL